MDCGNRAGKLLPVGDEDETQLRHGCRHLSLCLVLFAGSMHTASAPRACCLSQSVSLCCSLQGELG